MDRIMAGQNADQVTIIANGQALAIPNSTRVKPDQSGDRLNILLRVSIRSIQQENEVRRDEAWGWRGCSGREIRGRGDDLVAG